MASVMVPIVDTGNPMYRPDITASAHLRRIRQTRPSSSRYSNSFIYSLSRSDLHISSDDTCLEDTFLFRRQQKAQPSPLSPLPPPSTKRKVVDVSNTNAKHHLKKRKLAQFEDSSPPSNSNVTEMRFPVLFNAIQFHDSSGSAFEHSINKQPPWLFPKENTQPSPHLLARLHRNHPLTAMPHSENPYHMPSHTYTTSGDPRDHPNRAETPKSLSCLLSDLNRQLPDMSLLEKLSRFDRITCQNIVDLLGADGYLRKHILEYFKVSRVERIDLSATLSPTKGLNEQRPCVVLEIFSSPHSFMHLKALNLNNVCLDDFDLTSIHHLGSLTTLWLNNTTIGTEAIGHLTSLKKQLIELHVEDNPRITDDCIPSLCLFSSLIVLRLHGTRIGMPGLRRLAVSIHSGAREIDIEIPSECETYLDDLHAQYQLHPISPHITDPTICTHLSLAALKANLAAHAVFNPSISISGTKLELAGRLRGILERREGDKIVKEVVWGYEYEGGH